MMFTDKKYFDSQDAIAYAKRLETIIALRNTIKTAIVSNLRQTYCNYKYDCEYEKKECRFLFHTTQSDEKIYIQFPGKETKRAPETDFRRGDPTAPIAATNFLDFRPKLITRDGIQLRDLELKDFWIAIESMYNSNQNCDRFWQVLFSLGKMTNHRKIERDLYSYSIVLYDSESKTYALDAELENVPPLNWYKLSLEKETLSSLNALPKVNINNTNVSISVEALIYYLEAILLAEDQKYFWKNKLTNDVGRPNTIGSLFALLSHLKGETSLPDLLQSFVRFRGIGEYDYSNIYNITDGAISYYNVKATLISAFNTNNIPCKTSTKEYDSKRYSCIRLPQIKTVIITDYRYDPITDFIPDDKWNVENIADITDEFDLSLFIDRIINMHLSK